MNGIHELKRLASPFNVLYVEDEAPLREQMGRFLGKLFARVEVAADGREGLLRFGRGHYDLVITDIRMPGIDGLEMIDRIRTRNTEVPIIVSTAFNENDYLLRAIESGVSHFLLKPLDTNSLVEALRKTLAQIGLERRVRQLSARVRELLNLQTNLVVVVREGEVTTANHRFLEQFGVENLQEFRAKGYAIGDFLLEEEGYCRPHGEEGWLNACMAAPGVPQKAKMRSPATGEARVYLVNGAPLPGPEEEYVLTFTDIDGVEAQYRALQEEAATDPLTRLPNRLKFHPALGDQIRQARQERRPLGLILFKPDDFSAINDHYGYRLGDRMVSELAELIQANLAPAQTLARLSGVQFAILCRASDLPRTRTLAERLRSATEHWPFSHGIHLTCSFGVAQLRPAENPEALFNRGDRRLIEARRQGPGGLATDREEERPEREREEEEIRTLIQEAAAAGVALNFYNNFKGLGINGSGRLLPELTGKELTFEVHGNLAKAMGRERTTILSCEHLPRRVAGRVARVSMQRLTAALDDLRYTDSSAMDRATLRIQPDTPIPVEIRGPDGVVQGEIVDLSLKAVAVRLPALGRLRLGTDLRLHFALPGSREGADGLVMEGRVLKLDEFSAEAVITLLASRLVDERLRPYISQRQLELVHELQAFSV